MLTVAFAAAFLAFSAISGVSAHSTHELRGLKMARQDKNSPFSAAKFPDVQKVLEGNARFQKNRDTTALQELVEDGQSPPFMMISCSDSRAPEATVFDSQPGTFFMERNIANQYKIGDENAQSVMAYGITVLGVQHLVVLGHYGCGGVAASIASKPKSNVNVATHVVQTWISDVRQLYLQSNRTEIAEIREKNLAIEAEGGTVPEPDIKDPGFRALVEENVKLGVKRLSESSVILNLHERLAAEGNSTREAKEKRAEEAAPLKPVFIHGWVYDLELGTVTDLNVSTGPKGFEDFVPNTTPDSKTGEESKTGDGEASTTQSEKETTSTTESAKETGTTTEEAAKESTTEPVAELTTDTTANVVQEPASTPDAAVNVLGHHTIPVKRSNMLARFKRGLPQQRSYGKRFSRQI